MERDAAAHTPYTPRDRVAELILPDAPITDRDRLVVETLAKRVRFLTLAQVARVWWCGDPNSVARASRRIGRLGDIGLVGTCRVMIHPELPLRRPLAVWSPGDARPGFGAVAYEAHTRWTQPLRIETVVFATERAADAAGGHAGRPPKASEATHDAHVSAVYLRLLAARPDTASTWMHESAILAGRVKQRYRRRKPRYEKLPDAVVGVGEGTTFIEFAGAYARERVRAFHRYCEEQQTGYQLW